MAHLARCWKLREQWVKRSLPSLFAALQGDTFPISAVFLSIKIPYFSNGC
eukprot:SAG31_NODE_14625_length_796_cov_0.862267_1_plen_49_part_01